MRDGRAIESRERANDAGNAGRQRAIGMGGERRVLEIGTALPLREFGGKLKLANQTRYLCNLIVTLIKIASDEDPPRRGWYAVRAGYVRFLFRVLCPMYISLYLLSNHYANN